MMITTWVSLPFPLRYAQPYTLFTYFYHYHYYYYCFLLPSGSVCVRVIVRHSDNKKNNSKNGSAN